MKCQFLLFFIFFSFCFSQLNCNYFAVESSIYTSDQFAEKRLKEVTPEAQETLEKIKDFLFSAFTAQDHQNYKNQQLYDIFCDFNNARKINSIVNSLMYSSKGEEINNEFQLATLQFRKAKYIADIAAYCIMDFLEEKIGNKKQESIQLIIERKEIEKLMVFFLRELKKRHLLEIEDLEKDTSKESELILMNKNLKNLKKKEKDINEQNSCFSFVADNSQFSSDKKTKGQKELIISKQDTNNLIEHLEDQRRILNELDHIIISKALHTSIFLSNEEIKQIKQKAKMITKNGKEIPGSCSSQDTQSEDSKSQDTQSEDSESQDYYSLNDQLENNEICSSQQLNKKFVTEKDRELAKEKLNEIYCLTDQVFAEYCDKKNQDLSFQNSHFIEYLNNKNFNEMNKLQFINEIIAIHKVESELILKILAEEDGKLFYRDKITLDEINELSQSFMREILRIMGNNEEAPENQELIQQAKKNSDTDQKKQIILLGGVTSIVKIILKKQKVIYEDLAEQLQAQEVQKTNMLMLNSFSNKQLGPQLINCENSVYYSQNNKRNKQKGHSNGKRNRKKETTELCFTISEEHQTTKKKWISKAFFLCFISTEIGTYLYFNRFFSNEQSVDLKFNEE